MSKLRPTSADSRFDLLTRLAFVLGVALVLARVMMPDVRRDDDLTPGAPRGAGVAVALTMDFLACLPAILILARRVSDKQYVLRWSWSAAPMLGLAAWGVMSVMWAADRFAAVGGAAQYVAAAALLWAMSQLVRSWRRLRLVAAMSVGMLVVLLAHCIMYAAIDRPELVASWNAYICPNPVHRGNPPEQKGPGICPEHGTPLIQRKEIIFREQGHTKDDFASKQLENKILNGEQQGFFTSPNTLGAVAVLLAFIAAGMVGQRVRDDGLGTGGSRMMAVIVFVMAMGVAAGAVVWLLLQSRSKTAVATSVLGAILLAMAWSFRGVLARQARKVFWISAAVIGLGAIAIVAHGVYHKSLFSETLTFRWHYWTGAAKIIAQHPLIGVGQDNFGLYYLGARLPEAPEEVAEPHNFLVKYASELGLIGALSCLAWLGRMAWELTRPVLPAEPEASVKREGATKENRQGGGDRPGGSALKVVSIISVLAMLISVLLETDFSAYTASGGGELVLLLLRRMTLLAAMLIVGTLCAVRSLKRTEMDERPAPLLLYALMVGLGLFIVHNLIDFSLFEPGPMWLFALLAGAALGVRQPSAAGQRKRTAMAAIALGGAIVVWLVGAGFVWVPIALAEDAAHSASRAAERRDATRALMLLADARDQVRYNAQYPYRAAMVLGASRPFDQGVLNYLDSAIATNPMQGDYRRARARYLADSPERLKQADLIRTDYLKAIELNPNNVRLHLELADFLASLETPADRAAAIEQYEKALWFNGQLKQNEPKRMAKSAVAEVEGKIAKLKGK